MFCNEGAGLLGKQDPTLGMAFLGEGELRQDSNFNFVGEVYDSNENWSQTVAGTRMEEDPSQMENMRNPSDNLVLLVQRQTEDVRSPPEGAEVSSAELEKAATEDVARECDKSVVSPLEDNGYGSSSLSIDSPDSSTDPQLPDTDSENSSDSDTIFPVLAEAFQNIQDKERFKEQEKEKHHIQLVMYRRLALLRWIRGLQQKVIDQQNRLQESFDTILDNRKELIKYIQQGMVHPRELAHASLAETLTTTP
uniref:Chromosome 1 open reading frame 216 n=1 Tax=Crocodylus porosus TaxID=8502 RepID=A0A7M4FJU1_CROPO